MNEWQPVVHCTEARKFWFGREDEGRQGMFAIGFDSYKRQALFRFGPEQLEGETHIQWIAIGSHDIF